MGEFGRLPLIAVQVRPVSVVRYRNGRKSSFRNPFLATNAVLAACGDPSSMMTGPDAGGDDDASTIDAPPGCTEPSLTDPALRTYLTGALSRLPAPRATTTQRNNARTFLTDELTSLGLSPQLDDYATGANVIATLKAVSTAFQHPYTDQQASDLADVLVPDLLTYKVGDKSGFLNGRRLTDDVIDTLLAVGANTPGASDCIANDSAFTSSFPFEGAPN